MNQCGRLWIIVFLMLLIVNSGSAQVEISREQLFQVPGEMNKDLIGMRYSGGRVFIANAAGRYVRYDLETRESFSGKLAADSILDFDLVLGQIVFLDASGKIGGRNRSTWPDRQYDATSIEVCNEGLLMAGGDKVYFLSKNATQAIEIEGLHFGQPINNGFFWTLQIRPKTGLWGADLYDNLGNLMKEVYNFSSEFVPAGLEIGPAGPEGELLISAFENNERKLSLIANNGHMFWKIPGPGKFARRDVAFDEQGNLLVLEKNADKTWLSRWKMATPEG